MPTNLPRAHSQHNTIQINKQSDVRCLLFLVLATNCLANHLHLSSSIWNRQRIWNDVVCNLVLAFTGLTFSWQKSHPEQGQVIRKKKIALCLLSEPTSFRHTDASYLAGRLVPYFSHHSLSLEKWDTLFSSARSVARLIFGMKYEYNSREKESDSQANKHPSSQRSGQRFYVKALKTSQVVVM